MTYINNMKKYLTVLFLSFGIFGNAQIVSNETKEEETQIVKKEKPTKPKQGTEIYFGVSPAYTFRTLEVNEGLFAKSIGHRADESGEWTAGFNLGARTKIHDFLKLEIGVGYASNKESFDYTKTDSVYRYNNTYRHISFPIRIAYTFGEDISFYGGLGIIPKAFLSMKHEETVLDPFGKEQTSTTTERDKFNMFLIDAVATLGTQVKLNKHYGLVLMVEGRRQLTNNFNAQSPYIRKAFALGFNIGVEVYL